MGGGIGGVAHLQFACGAGDDLDHAAGDVVLHEQQAQRRAALSGRAERRCHHVVGDLFGQRGGIDDLALMPPVSAISGTIGPSLAARCG